MQKERIEPRTRGREQCAGAGGGRRKGEHAKKNGGWKERRRKYNLRHLQIATVEEDVQKTPHKDDEKSGDGRT